MLKWKQFLLSPVCVGCASFFCGPTLYCSRCYDILIEQKICEQVGSHSHLGDRHIYLFDWKRGESAEFSQLVYRLKSDNSVQALGHFATLLASRLLELYEPSKFAAVVPVPSANPASFHATILAKRIAEVAGMPLWSPLEKIGLSVQKNLSAAERGNSLSIRLKADADEEFTARSNRSDKYILVDDVLTTGQSFKQASAALGGNKNNIIGTLFYRSI